jgi:hypothetical protein
LNHKGSISHEQMKNTLDSVYEDFNARRKQDEAEKADEQDLEELAQLESKIKTR